MPSREPPLEPRLVATVPECVPPWRHTLDEDSPADEIVSRAGDGCGEGWFEYEAKMARPPPCIADRARRSLLPFREEQEASPPPPA